MIGKIQRLTEDNRGVTAVEAAILLPVLLMMVIGISQLSILYFANSGLRHLVAEGARLANTHPRPTDSALKARLRQGGFGLVQQQLSEPVITYGKEDTSDFADIEMTYSVQLQFVFFSTEAIQLRERRRVYLYLL